MSATTTGPQPEASRLRWLFALAAPASMLAPFNYTALVWAMLFGYFFFAELPDPITLTGAAIIVSAGLYVWHRERVRKQTSAGADR